MSKGKAHLEKIREKIREEIVQDVDGFYYWNPQPPLGYFNEYHLEEIVQELKRRNRDWNEYIKEHLKD